MEEHEYNEPQQTELQQTERLALPGWGTPFPEEKPRIDEAARPPSGLPTAASVAAASAVGEEADADFTNEDRRPLDRRRRKARVIDSLILAPFAFLIVQMTQGVTVGAALLVLALELSYYFVFESLKGQTIGKKIAKLRVVHADGSAPSAAKIAVRTLVRPIDYTIAGIITVLATGQRRQRLGDLAAGTIVREDNRIFHGAPESPLLVAFPLACIGLAVAGMIALKPGDPMLDKRNPHPYMAKIDKICEKQKRQAQALARTGELNVISARLLVRQETRKIEKLPKPPAEVKADVAEVLAHHRRISLAIDRMVSDVRRSTTPGATAARHDAIITGLIDTAEARYAELGLPYCASGTSH